jgi:hypothetical protein
LSVERQTNPRFCAKNELSIVQFRGYSPAVAGKIAIVTAGNSEYFYLLDGLIASLEDARLPSDFQFCALDVGLDPLQALNLKSRNVTVISPSWTINFPNQANTPTWFRAMTNRPCLPDHFPGFETYIWIDADAWIQQPEGIHAAVEAARNGSIAIVPERFGNSITYPQWNGLRWVLLKVNEASSRAAVAKCYRTCFGAETEHRARETIFNTGFFALRGDSPIWTQWLKRIRHGIAHGIFEKLIEQQALNLEILEGTIPATLLPSRFNWMLTGNEPLYDLQTRRIVDPDEHKPIGMLHLTDVKFLHFVEIPSTDGQMVKLRLRYRDFRGNPADVCEL